MGGFNSYLLYIVANLPTQNINWLSNWGLQKNWLDDKIELNTNKSSCGTAYFLCISDKKHKFKSEHII